MAFSLSSRWFLVLALVCCFGWSYTLATAQGTTTPVPLPTSTLVPTAPLPTPCDAGGCPVPTSCGGSCGPTSVPAPTARPASPSACASAGPATVCGVAMVMVGYGDGTQGVSKLLVVIVLFGFSMLICLKLVDMFVLRRE